MMHTDLSHPPLYLPFPILGPQMFSSYFSHLMLLMRSPTVLSMASHRYSFMTLTIPKPTLHPTTVSYLTLPHTSMNTSNRTSSKINPGSSFPTSVTFTKSLVSELHNTHQPRLQPQQQKITRPLHVLTLRCTCH
jgi:hypothetical protein